MWTTKRQRCETGLEKNRDRNTRSEWQVGWTPIFSLLKQSIDEEVVIFSFWTGHQKMVKLSWKCEGTNHFLLVRILLSAYGTSNATFLCFSLVGLVEWIIFLIWWLAVKYREGQLHLHGIGRLSYGWRQEGNSVSGSLINPFNESEYIHFKCKHFKNTRILMKSFF